MSPQNNKVSLFIHSILNSPSARSWNIPVHAKKKIFPPLNIIPRDDIERALLILSLGMILRGPLNVTPRDDRIFKFMPKRKYSRLLILSPAGMILRGLSEYHPWE